MGNSRGAEKRTNGQLGSWFVRSGWSKGELARQVNRRARGLGAHHISTDTSRVRRWLDGEQPREPIPRVLSELFSECFGTVVTVEDLGLRSARQFPTASGVDLPWAGPETVASINDFSRGDLMLGGRGFLGSSLAMSAGPALVESMRRWLAPASLASAGPPDLAGFGRGGKPAASPLVPASGRPAARAAGEGPPRREELSPPELELLEQTTVMFRRWDAQCGGGLRRKAVVGQLHEVTDLMHDAQREDAGARLFRVTAELADLAGWMSYDLGMQPTAQKYFVLALHAAREAGDRPLGAYILSNMARQLIHLARPEDALELTHLAQYGSREDATARTQAMLYAVEARAYANLGQVNRCARAVRMAETIFADIEPADDEPDWVRFFSEAEMHSENAHSYRDLAYAIGHSPTYASLAEPEMERAVELFGREALEDEGGGHQRSYALNLIGLASVHLLRRQPEQCVNRTREAIDVATRLRSERVNTRIRKTAAAAAREFGQVPEVARLTERLARESPGGAPAVAC